MKVGQKGKRRAFLVRTDREMVGWMDMSAVCAEVLTLMVPLTPAHGTQHLLHTGAAAI